MTISNNTAENIPAYGFIQWVDVHMQFMGVTYDIADGYTNAPYVYWTLADPTNLKASTDFPTLTVNDCLLFLNKNGMAIVVPTSTVLDGDLIVPGTILATALAANTITGDKIMAGAIEGVHIAAGTIDTDKLVANIIGANIIAAASIDGDLITAGAIDSTHLKANDATIVKIFSKFAQMVDVEALVGVFDVIRASVIESEALSFRIKDKLDDRMTVSTDEPLTVSIGHIWLDTNTDPAVYKHKTADGWAVISDEGAVKAALQGLDDKYSLMIRADDTGYLTIRNPEEDGSYGIDIGHGVVAIVDNDRVQVARMTKGESFFPSTRTNSLQVGQFLTSVLDDNSIIEQWEADV